MLIKMLLILCFCLICFALRAWVLFFGDCTTLFNQSDKKPALNQRDKRLHGLLFSHSVRLFVPQFLYQLPCAVTRVECSKYHSLCSVVNPISHRGGWNPPPLPEFAKFSKFHLESISRNFLTFSFCQLRFI